MASSTSERKETVEQVAQRLRDIWKLGEGPQVEQALYDYACRDQSPATTFEAASWAQVLQAFHTIGVDDQFIPPLVRLDAGTGKPLGTVRPGDVVFCFDFRTDRAKPLTAAFLDVPFGGQVGGLSEIARSKAPADVTVVTMTHYDDAFTKSARLREAFNPAEPLQDTYAEVAGRAGVKQLVCAESEKWRAVTWFKDGRRNLGYQKQEENDLIRTDRHPKLPITVRIVKSRQVAAHIQAPMMRAKEITDELLKGISEGVPDIFVNYANSDMVGHAMTDIRDFDSVVNAILELDTQLGRLVPAALKAGYTVFVTADHGNAEDLAHPDGKANPAHTTNKVPFILLGLREAERKSCSLREDFTIGELAPTVLHLRGIKRPKSWDRESVLQGPVKSDKKRPILKVILDGYGINLDEKQQYNAMAAATRKKGSPLHIDRWMKGEDGALSRAAEASGARCGYPAGEAGTTEFGHVLFDAGRTVRSDVTLIDFAIESGAFKKNVALLEAIRAIKNRPNARLHIMGITSDGMVHSSLKHLEAFMRLAAEEKAPSERISLHVITDGRDVPGDSSPKYIKWLEDLLKEVKIGRIDSIWGRGWGKDRDNRWKRIESAFRSLCEGTAAMHLKFTSSKP